MNAIEDIRAKVRCSACQGKITGRINLVELRRRATWDYPCSGNVMTGEDHVATAICCDVCVESKREIVEAVEFAGDQVVYHPVNELEALPPPQEFALLEHHGVAGIRCLMCGMTSWNQNDVRERYCGKCHAFLQGPR